VETHYRSRPGLADQIANELRAAGGDFRVLDIGSGLAGPAQTLAEVYGCDVSGIN